MSACRDWQKTIFPASFKGAPFEVDSDSVSGGRRIVTHEYPGREAWDNEDVGKGKQTVEVTGYTHGDLADQQAQRLFEACCGIGPGMLVLPTMPNRMARCVKVDRAFKADALGRIEIRMSFVLESGAIGGLASFAYLLGAVVNAVASAMTDIRTSFERDYNARNAPNVAREAATETVRLAATGISAAFAELRLDPAKAPLIAHNIATLDRDARILSFGGEGQDVITATVFASSSLRRSNFLGARLSEALTGIAAAAGDKAATATALEALTRFEAQTITNPVNTPSVIAERDLTSRIARLVRLMALVKWAEAKALAGFVTKAEAVETRALVAGRLSEEADVAVSELELNALLEVRNAITSYITRNGAERPVTRTVQLHYPSPILVIAHEIYGDPARDTEMIVRNAIPHPLQSPYEFEVSIP